MLFKLTGLGFKQYFLDKFNTFDFIVIIISTIDVILSLSKTFELKGGSAVQAFRTFRLLRVFKLAKSWKQFQHLLKTINHTLKDISTFSILLFLFIFTYTILGMEWFAYKVPFIGDPNPTQATYIDSNFNTFLEAFLSVFVVLTGDTWSNTYYQHFRAVGGVVSTFFFLSLMLVGQYILLMLFLAILV